MPENATDTDDPTVKHVSTNGKPRNEEDHGGDQQLRVEHAGETYTAAKGDAGMYEHPGEDAPKAVVQAVAEVNDGLDAADDRRAAPTTGDADGEE